MSELMSMLPGLFCLALLGYGAWLSLSEWIRSEVALARRASADTSLPDDRARRAGFEALGAM